MKQLKVVRVIVADTVVVVGVGIVCAIWTSVSMVVVMVMGAIVVVVVAVIGCGRISAYWLASRL